MPLTLTDQSSHLGRAGQFAVMAELFARGWNVSVPEVDVGDHVFVARDDATELTRVQVKTATPAPSAEGRVARFKVSADQALRVGNVPLVFVFVVPGAASWDHFVVPQNDLLDLRRRYLTADRGKRGRPASSHAETWMFEVLIAAERCTAWGADLARWRNDWSAFRLLTLDRGDATAPDPSRSP